MPSPLPADTNATPAFSDLLTALAHPECYPHHPEHVEVVQTHISAVFLAGDEVYKLKKPVKFSFLDYSTPELRHYYCQEEVRLNRRLAPTVYLGVVPVLYADNTYRVRDALALHHPTVVDYLVRMRRLSPTHKLDVLLAEGRLTKENIAAIATRLAHFHTTASAHDAARYGAPEVIWQAIQDNFDNTAAFVGRTITVKQYERIQRFSKDFFDSQQKLLQRRIAEKRVREGHGDLRCDHIYLLDEGVTIVDCIEFNPRLRTCDVASELAFLAMDLELHGAPSLAAELIQAYATQAEDETLGQLLPFYQCYRAYVRGKVESLKSQEPEIAPEEQERARAEARRSFRLAARYARSSPRPALVVVCGRVGVGKSTVAHILSNHTGFVVMNSDVMRKRLAGLSPTARAGAEYSGGIYTPAFTERTYTALEAAAEAELLAGRGVIVDATFKQQEYRQRFLALGARLGSPVLFIECWIDPQTVERRLRERAKRGDSVSDATWEIAQREEPTFPAFDDIPDQQHVRVETNASVEERLMEAEDLLLLEGSGA